MATRNGWNDIRLKVTSHFEENAQICGWSPS